MWRGVELARLRIAIRALPTTPRHMRPCCDAFAETRWGASTAAPTAPIAIKPQLLSLTRPRARQLLARRRQRCRWWLHGSGRARVPGGPRPVVTVQCANVTRSVRRSLRAVIVRQRHSQDRASYRIRCCRDVPGACQATRAQSLVCARTVRCARTCGHGCFTRACANVLGC